VFLCFNVSTIGVGYDDRGMRPPGGFNEIISKVPNASIIPGDPYDGRYPFIKYASMVPKAHDTGRRGIMAGF
jgi:hypothetical protein